MTQRHRRMDRYKDSYEKLNTPHSEERPERIETTGSYPLRIDPMFVDDETNLTRSSVVQHNTPRSKVGVEQPVERKWVLYLLRLIVAIPILAIVFIACRWYMIYPYYVAPDEPQLYLWQGEDGCDSLLFVINPDKTWEMYKTYHDPQEGKGAALYTRFHVSGLSGRIVMGQWYTKTDSIFTLTKAPRNTKPLILDMSVEYTASYNTDDMSETIGSTYTQTVYYSRDYLIINNMELVRITDEEIPFDIEFLSAFIEWK